MRSSRATRDGRWSFAARISRTSACRRKEGLTRAARRRSRKGDATWNDGNAQAGQTSAGRGRVRLGRSVVEDHGGRSRADRLLEGLVRAKDERRRIEGVVGVDRDPGADTETDARGDEALVHSLLEVLLDGVKGTMRLHFARLDR